MSEDVQRYRMLYTYMTIIFMALLARIFLPSYFYAVVTTSLILFSLPVAYTIAFYRQDRRKFVRGPTNGSNVMMGVVVAFFTGFLIYISLGGTDFLLYSLAFMLGFTVYLISEQVPVLISKVIDAGNPLAVLATSFLLAGAFTLLLSILAPLLP